MLKKDWVHLSHQGAKPSGQKKEELEPSGNFSFGVRTAWTMVCCWEFLAQQTVWSLEEVLRRQQRGREESMSHLGLQTGEGSCQVSGCPWGGLHSAGLPQLKSAVLGTSKSAFLCLSAGISQTHNGNCTGKLPTLPLLRASSCKLFYWSHCLLRLLGLLKLLHCPEEVRSPSSHNHSQHNVLPSWLFKSEVNVPSLSCA